MIVTQLYKGQGLGNQLACYVTTRVIAHDRGYAFGIQDPHHFKGNDFFDLDFGEKVIGGTGPEGGPPAKLPDGILHYYAEKKSLHPSGADIRTYDSALTSIADNTKIDGLMQGEEYFLHRKTEIRKWLTVKKEYECFDYADDNTCVINFRGGEYSRHPEFFLNKQYWRDAVTQMLRINKNFRFIVITDDVFTAKKFFPEYGVFHFSIAKDYVIIKNAHYLILSNSSFAWFPAWLNDELKFCIAPKYWARHNVSDGYWSLGYNITNGWHYLGRDGVLYDYDACVEELKNYTLPSAEHYLEISPRPTTWKMKIKKYLPPQIKMFIKSCIYFVNNILMQLRSPWDTWKANRAEKLWVSKIDVIEYKKTITVYDVFYLFNELDLLEIRLNILNDYVDYFVIVESTTSFSGIAHELQYKKYEDRFVEWREKIIYYVVDDFPHDTTLLTLAQNNSNTGAGEHYWVREFYQKESAKKALVGLSDTDVVFISDLDEIWNPLQLKALTDFSKSALIRPKQLAYYYYLNNRCNEKNGWTGTIVAQYKTIKNNCINDLRTRGKTTFAEIDFGGWHFGFMGGVDGAMKKLVEWQHPEYANWVDTLKERVTKNKDYRGRTYTYWTDESDLPSYILEHKEKYKKLFK